MKFFGPRYISLFKPQSLELKNVCFYHQHLKISRIYPYISALDTSQTKHSVKCKSQSLSSKLGLINIASGGIHTILPFLNRSLEKLCTIVDLEMMNVGGQKVSLPCLSLDTPWKLSGRWNDMGSELFTLSDRNDAKYCLSPTHEEAVTSLVATNSPISYKQLPLMLYQIGRKYRDEGRPKNGLLRGREFEMKDMYSFDANLKDAIATYEKVCESYKSIFSHLGLRVLYVDGDVGNMGGIKSQEFHLISNAGEDRIYSCPSCGLSKNREMMKENETDLCDCDSIKKNYNCIEVAHAFLLGTKYSEVFKATCKLSDNSISPLHMGCYGIGLTRLIAASIEVLSSDNFIQWPKLIAPYQVIVISQKKGFRFEDTKLLAEAIHKDILTLPNMSYEAILDDRHDISIGKKLQQALALGYPYAVIIGNQALNEDPLYELVNIYSKKKSTLHSKSEILKILSKIKTVSSSFIHNS